MISIKKFTCAMQFPHYCWNVDSVFTKPKLYGTLMKDFFSMVRYTYYLILLMYFLFLFYYFQWAFVYLKNSEYIPTFEFRNINL